MMNRNSQYPPRVLVETWLSAYQKAEYPEFQQIAKERIETVFGSAEIAQFYLLSLNKNKDAA